MNPQKLIKSLALTMLHVKGDYLLSEYVTTLKHAIDLADVEFELGEIDPSTNLFEYYSEFDLSFLKGQAIIIPL